VILDVTLRRGTPDPDAVASLVGSGVLVRTAPGGAGYDALAAELAAAAA